MSEHIAKRPVLTSQEQAKRKRYLRATLVTCAALAMLGGSIHVVMLGANRMEDMRNKASYDLKDMPSRIRAAGEDIQRHAQNEHKQTAVQSYAVAEAAALLTPEQWRELETMVKVPAGAFIMGTDREQADSQDQPAHRVDVPEYWMDKYPVTNAQYARFVAATGHRAPLHWENGRIPQGEERHPVTMVSWYDANSYAAWAGKRLPTEAEWEKAARGTDERRWPWGNGMDPSRLNTYYSVGSTTDVTAYPSGASPYGAMDMAGNVSQWLADDFAPYPGSQAPSALFQGKMAVANTPADRAFKVVDLVPVEGRYKVLRGGSWKSDPFSTAVYHRNYSWPHYASNFFGFRCVRDAANQAAAKVK